MERIFGTLSYLSGSLAMASFAMAMMASAPALADGPSGGGEFGGYTCTDESATKTCHCKMLASGPDIGSACETNETSGCKETECTCRRINVEDGPYCGRQARPPVGED